jgi:hypothetical protein
LHELGRSARHGIADEERCAADRKGFEIEQALGAQAGPICTAEPDRDVGVAIIEVQMPVQVSGSRWMPRCLPWNGGGRGTSQRAASDAGRLSLTEFERGAPRVGIR